MTFLYIVLIKAQSSCDDPLRYQGFCYVYWPTVGDGSALKCNSCVCRYLSDEMKVSR